jgi:hypothetical protein
LRGPHGVGSSLRISSAKWNASASVTEGDNSARVRGERHAQGENTHRGVGSHQAMGAPGDRTHSTWGGGPRRAVRPPPVRPPARGQPTGGRGLSLCGRTHPAFGHRCGCSCSDPQDTRFVAGRVSVSARCERHANGTRQPHDRDRKAGHASREVMRTQADAHRRRGASKARGDARAHASSHTCSLSSRRHLGDTPRRYSADSSVHTVCSTRARVSPRRGRAKEGRGASRVALSTLSGLV